MTDQHTDREINYRVSDASMINTDNNNCVIYFGSNKPLPSIGKNSHVTQNIEEALVFAKTTVKNLGGLPYVLEATIDRSQINWNTISINSQSGEESGTLLQKVIVIGAYCLLDKNKIND